MNTERARIEREAAVWLARHDDGLTSVEEGHFAQWREQDPRHAACYEDLRSSWAQLDQLSGSPVAARLEAELDQLSARSDARIFRFPEVLEAFRQAPRLSGALAACCALLLAYVAWWRPLQARAPFSDTIVTEVGGSRTVVLPDGSSLRLNTATSLEVHFTKEARRIRLDRGEAFFVVAKNPGRPFIVTSAGVDVRAVGTEFNVRRHAGAVEVTVREGAVRVDDAGQGASLLARAAASSSPGNTPAPVLKAGERIMVPVIVSQSPAPMPAVPVSLTAADIEQTLAWQQRRLVFDSVPLSTIVAEFNRYNRQPLTIPDAELASRHFGGSFDARDPRTFVQLLQASYDVVAEDGAGATVLRLRR